MAARKRGSGGGGNVDWMPIIGKEESNLDSLAAGAQATVFDTVIANPIVGGSYDAGTIVGLRLWLSVVPGTSIYPPPKLVLMVLPNGATVPTVNTAVLLKNNENVVWAIGEMDIQESGNGYPQWRLALDSVRNFSVGSRLVLVLFNQSAIPFSAAAIASYLVDAYVRER